MRRTLLAGLVLLALQFPAARAQDLVAPGEGTETGLVPSDRKSPLPLPPVGLASSGKADGRDPEGLGGKTLPGLHRGGGLAWKSALLPGWGQWSAGRRRRGVLIGLPALGLVGASIWAGWAQRRAVHAYDGAPNAGSASFHADRAGDLRALATAFGTAGAGLWLFGVLDASLTPQGPAVQVGFRFP